MKNKKILSDFWLNNYVNKEYALCGLCGNTGIINTTNSAVSPAGIKCGGKYFCVCPNGRVIKEQKARAANTSDAVENSTQQTK